MKRSIAVLLLAVIGQLLPGCDKSTEKKPDGTTSKFRVAMILHGSDTDAGWDQLAREGLDRIKSELGVQTNLLTNVQSNDFAGRISYFADQGYEVIICHGYEFGGVVKGLSAKYPKTHFIIGGFSDPVPGAVSVEFLAGDASSLVGVAAGVATKTDIVAFVGADPVPTLQACYDGLKDGLAKTKPDAKLLDALWTNSWSSPTKAREKAEGALNAGADVIYQNVDAAAVGVFQAVQDSHKSGKQVYAFGCNRNQNDKAPEVILGSVVLDVPKAYLDITKEAISDKWHERVARLGLKEGYVDLVLNDANPGVTPDLKAKVDAARKAITSATTQPAQ